MNKLTLQSITIVILQNCKNYENQDEITKAEIIRNVTEIEYQENFDCFIITDKNNNNLHVYM